MADSKQAGYLGCCLIIANDYSTCPFSKSYRDLPGTQEDLKDYAQTFQKLKFKVDPRPNLNKADMTDALESLRRTPDSHPEMKYVLFVFCGHGEDGFIISQQGEKVPVDEVVGLFQPKRDMEKMGEVIKLFFIDACRGKREDPGIRVIARGGELAWTKRVPQCGNFLVAYATLPQHEAFEIAKVEIGGLWSKFLNKELRNDANINSSLLDILTTVNGKVVEFCEKEIGKFQNPQLVGTLRDHARLLKEAGSFEPDLPFEPVPATSMNLQQQQQQQQQQHQQQQQQQYGSQSQHWQQPQQQYGPQSQHWQQQQQQHGPQSQHWQQQQQQQHGPQSQHWQQQQQQQQQQPCDSQHQPWQQAGCSSQQLQEASQLMTNHFNHANVSQQLPPSPFMHLPSSQPETSWVRLEAFLSPCGVLPKREMRFSHGNQVSCEIYFILNHQLMEAQSFNHSTEEAAVEDASRKMIRKLQDEGLFFDLPPTFTMTTRTSQHPVASLSSQPLDTGGHNPATTPPSCYSQGPPDATSRSVGDPPVITDFVKELKKHSSAKPVYRTEHKNGGYYSRVMVLGCDVEGKASMPDERSAKQHVAELALRKLGIIK